MGNAEEILVVILSVALAVFLVLAIAVAIKVIQILNHLKSMTEKAEKLVTSAENVGEFFKNTAGTVALGKLVSNISEAVFKRSNKSKEE